MKASFLFGAILLLFSSCVPHKKMAYFQTGDGAEVVSNSISRIHPNDIISVNVSSMNPEADKQFNMASNNADPNYAPNTYLVDTAGMIEMPLVGMVKVGGLTTQEAKVAVRLKMEDYLKAPTVNVRFVNFRITVLGEVSKPGVYQVPNEKISVIEALGLAGDLTIYGRRDNVLIIRETEGKREFVEVNLQSRDFLASPNYYLLNNDVIYVEPSRGQTSKDDNLYRIIPIILSSLTFISVIATR